MSELQMKFNSIRTNTNLLGGDGQRKDVLLLPADDETKQEVKNEENDDAKDEEKEKDIKDGLTNTGKLPAVPCLAKYLCFCLSDDDIRCCLKAEKAPFWALSALIFGFAALIASFYESHLAVYIGSGCAVISTIASLVLFLVLSNRLGSMETTVTTLQTTVTTLQTTVTTLQTTVRDGFADAKKDRTLIMEALGVTREDV
jgi:hypothetical protein